MKIGPLAAIITLGVWTEKMRIPAFVNDLEDEGTTPLNVRAAPFKAYTAIIGWVKDHTLEHGITYSMDEAPWDLAAGSLKWPTLRGDGEPTPPAHIRRVIDEVIWKVTGSEPTPTMSLQAATKKALSLVHPDKQPPNRGSRLNYASEACTAFLNRCKDVAAFNDTGSNNTAYEAKDVTDLMAMPNIMITPFKTSEVDAHPPSAFELMATDTAIKQQQIQVSLELWDEVKRVGEDPRVTAAESRFFHTNWFSRRPQDLDIRQIYFATFQFESNKRGEFEMRGASTFETREYVSDVDADEVKDYDKVRQK